MVSGRCGRLFAMAAAACLWPGAAFAQVGEASTTTVAPLPNTFVVEPMPAALTWPRFRPGETLLITLRNTTTEAVAFKDPTVVGFARMDGDAVNAAAAARPPRINAHGCPSPLAAGESCAVELRLRDRLRPGEYRIAIGMAGTAGGWSEVNQLVRVRASAVIAFTVIVLGVAAGWYVANWRSSGRRALTALVDLARLRERLTDLAREAANGPLAPMVAGTLAEADEIETRIRKGQDVAPDFDLLSGRTANLRGGLEIERGFRDLPPPGRTALQPRRDALLAHLRKDAGSDGTAAFAGLLAEDIGAWAGLAAAAAKAQGLAAAIDRLESAVGEPLDGADPGATRLALQQAVATALAPLPAVASVDGAETVAARRDALLGAVSTASAPAADIATAAGRKLLSVRPEEEAQIRDEAARRLQSPVDLAVPPGPGDVQARLEALAALWRTFDPAKTVVIRERLGPAAPEALPAALAPAGPIEVPISVVLPPRGTSQGALLRSQRRHEIATNMVVLLATGLAGVLALWATNASWGSVFDIIAAFLAGMGARVLIGEAGAAVQPPPG